MSNVRSDKPFTLAGRTFQSRLLVGTGKYRDMEETRLATEASGAEIVTVAVRRTNLARTRASRTCSMYCRPTSTPSCRTLQAALTRWKRYARAVWPANCSMGANRTSPGRW